MQSESPSEFTGLPDSRNVTGNIERFEDFRLLSVRGRMSFGTVRGHGRLWFVKALAPECRDITECRRSLVKEYEILLSLHHRGIVRAVALAEIEDAGPGIVMEYVEGEHLDRYAAHATLRQRRMVADELMDAMAYIHGRGFTHLDLKPENILVRGTVASPQICIIDFNLSDGAEFDVDKERGGNRLYSAPEQFERGYVASPTADVWSLGKLLAELKPGMSWHKAIRLAAKQNPQRRPPDASAMIAIERRSRRQIVWGIWIAICIIATAAALLSLRFFYKDTNIPVVKDIGVTAPVAEDMADTVVRDSPRVEESGNNGKSENVVIPDADKETREWDERHESHVRKVKQMVEDGMYRISHLATAASVSADERLENCVWAEVDIEMSLNALIDSFRAKCPEHILKTRPSVWGTKDDPAYAHDLERLQVFYMYVQEQLETAQAAGY